MTTLDTGAALRPTLLVPVPTHTLRALGTALPLYRVLTGDCRAGLGDTVHVPVPTATGHTGVPTVLKALPIPIGPTLVETAITLGTTPGGDGMLTFRDATVGGFACHVT